jgi:hypothetical protein
LGLQGLQLHQPRVRSLLLDPHFRV